MGKTESVTLDFTTKAKTVPTLSIEQGDEKQESFGFGITYTDPDHVGAVTKIELLHGEDAPIVAESVGVREFKNLLSDNDYIVRVTVVYDLNDGTGEHSFSETLAGKTKAKTVPTLSLEKCNVEQESFDFTLTYTDPDSVGAVTKIELLHGEDTPIVAENVGVREFKDLLSDNDYTLRVTVTYDLDNGNGEKSFSQTLDVQTKAKTVPTLSIEQGDVKQESFGFGITYTDPDHVGAVTKIELLHGEDAPIVAESVGVREFKNLLSDNDYIVRVTVVYDLNDGTGEHSFSETLAGKTKAKTVPTLSLEKCNVEQESFDFTLTYTDPDSVGAVTKIELLHGEDTPIVAENVGVREFKDLLSDNDYTLRVTVTYDLDNGNGEKSFSQTLDVKTKAKAVPNIEINDEKITSTSIDATYDISDTDAVLDSFIVELYNGETLVAQNTGSDISFADLDYLVDYTLKITYTYDLKDGNGIQTSVYKKSFITASYSLAYTVNSDNSTCTITGMGNCLDTIVAIPKAVDGYTVTVIGDRAFADNVSATVINIPDTVFSIGTRAFYNCSGITEITIPHSVENIGIQIFQGCTNLHTVYYNSNYGASENSFLSTKSIKTIVFGGSYIPSHIAQNATNLKTITILEGVSGIGDYAFFNCTSLVRVVIPEGVTSLASDSFRQCSSLTEIVLPDTLESLGHGVFFDCTSLTDIVLPNNLTSMLSGVFNGCTSLTSIVIPDGMIALDHDTFANCTNLKEVVIPDSVMILHYNSFMGCTSLESITIPNTITNVGDNVFEGCTNLANITFEGTVGEWTSITFGTNWNNGVPATEVICTDGNVALQ